MNLLNNEYISCYSNGKSTTNPIKISVVEAIDNFKSEKYKKSVLELRNKVKNGEEKEIISEFKADHLPGYTLSANSLNRVSGIPLKDKILKHSGLLQIDIDAKDIVKTPKSVDELLFTLQGDKHFVFLAKSPSGTGIKGAFYSQFLANFNDYDLIEDFHKQTFVAMSDYIHNKYKFDIDTQVSSLMNLMFATYDPDLYYNENFKIFDFQPTKEAKKEIIIPEKVKFDTSKYKDSNIQDRIIRTANRIINCSTDGNRHHSRLKAGYLLGGIVAHGLLTEQEAIDAVFDSIMNNTSLKQKAALKPVRDAIQAGSKKPLDLEQENKKYEKILNENEKIYFNPQTGEIIPYIFWHSETLPKGKIKRTISITKLYSMYNDFGYRILKVDAQEKIVQIINNIVEEKYSLSDLRKATETYINSLPDFLPNMMPDNEAYDFHKKELLEVFARGQENYISLAKMQFSAERIDLKDFVNDTYNKSYIFYRNCFVLVTSDDITTFDYSKLPGFIWKSEILDRDFKKTDRKLYEFKNFVQWTKNICSTRFRNSDGTITVTLDAQRYEALKSVIGYLLHRYNAPGNSKAIILTEANLDGTAKGRTGKNLLIDAISKIRQTTLPNGKDFDFSDRFKWQNVGWETNIIHISDIKQYFPFENLFSTITEGITVEKKNKDSFFIPQKQSPKFVLSTNYAITGDSDSYKARMFDMELLPYYDSQWTPDKEFGEWFFLKWEDSEWNLFDMFMLSNLQSYLATLKIVDYTSDTVLERKVIHFTSQEFVEFADDHFYKRLENVSVLQEATNASYYKFIKSEGIEESKFKKTKFTQWLKKYAEVRGLNFEAKNAKNNENEAERCYFLSKKEKI